MFVAVIIVGILVYNDGQQIKQQTITIKNNQYSNATAEETFIRQGLVCLATYPPNLNPTPAQVQTEANKCFANTPEIK